MLATRILSRGNIVILIDGQSLINNVLPFCKQELLISEIHDEFCKAFKKKNVCIAKYNQIALKEFFIKVLNMDCTEDYLKSVVEMCITRSIIIDCDLY